MVGDSVRTVITFCNEHARLANASLSVARAGRKNGPPGLEDRAALKEDDQAILREERSRPEPWCLSDGRRFRQDGHHLLQRACEAGECLVERRPRGEEKWAAWPRRPRGP